MSVLAEVEDFIDNITPDFVRYEPVIVAWALNGGLAILLGNLVGISPAQEAAVTTIITAAAAIFTMIKTDNFTVSGFTTTLTTVIVAAGAFGLHLSAGETGFGVGIISAVLSLVLRANVSPKLSS